MVPEDDPFPDGGAQVRFGGPEALPGKENGLDGERELRDTRRYLSVPELVVSPARRSFLQDQNEVDVRAIAGNSFRHAADHEACRDLSLEEGRKLLLDARKGAPEQEIVVGKDRELTSSHAMDHIQEDLSPPADQRIRGTGPAAPFPRLPRGFLSQERPPGRLPDGGARQEARRATRRAESGSQADHGRERPPVGPDP